MKKKNLVYGSISAAVMLLLPLLTVTFVKGDGGMAVCFLLFFGVNPIWSVLVGVFAGKNPKAAWFQPLLVSALFPAGTWLPFNMGEPAFLLYSAVYLALGLLSMLVSFLFTKKRRLT